MAKGTSDSVSKVAAKGLKYPERLTMSQIQMVCASALAQDEMAKQVASMKERIVRSREIFEAMLDG